MPLESLFLEATDKISVLLRLDPLLSATIFPEDECFGRSIGRLHRGPISRKFHIEFFSIVYSVPVENLDIAYRHRRETASIRMQGIVPRHLLAQPANNAFSKKFIPFRLQRQSPPVGTQALIRCRILHINHSRIGTRRKVHSRMPVVKATVFRTTVLGSCAPAT